MTQLMEYQLLDADRQFINVNGLGTPLAMYKMKPIYRFLLFVGGILLLVLGLTISGLVWYGDQVVDKVSFAMYVGLSLVGFLAGIYVLCVELPRIQRQHIVLCEQGLLQVKEMPRGRQLKVVYWRDILTIRRLYDGYYIMQRGGEAFTLDILYWHVKELVQYIKQKSQENESSVQSLEEYRLNREHLLLRAIEPIKGGTFFRIVFYIGIGLVALFGFIWVITGRTFFEWLMYGVLVMIPVVVVPVSYWRIKKIVTHIRANTPEE